MSAKVQKAVLKPHPAAASLLREIEKFTSQIESAETERSECQEELAGVVAAIINEELGSRLVGSDLEMPGVHECEKSPILTCVYDVVDDPDSDECLFCRQPAERK